MVAVRGLWWQLEGYGWSTPHDYDYYTKISNLFFIIPHPAEIKRSSQVDLTSNYYQRQPWLLLLL